jgi:hypothetical protein
MLDVYEQDIKMCEQVNGEALSSILVEELASHDKRNHKENN